MNRRMRVAVLTAPLLFAAVCHNSVFSQEKARPQVTETPLLISSDTAKWISCGGEEDGMPAGCEYAELYGDSTTGPSHALIRVPASARFPKLWHSTSEHGVMIQGKFLVTGDDGKEITVGPGMYWFFPAGLVHGGNRCSDDGPCLFYEYYDRPFDLTIVK